nr:RagB/SusD family nutrient uptake outer membrane protein [Aquimarina agarilytica]
MMLRYIKILVCISSLGFFTISCEKDLDVVPEDNRITADQVFTSEDGYRAGLAKLYGGYSLSGQRGPFGLPDLKGLNEGFSNYLRLYWKLQELTTDEAVIGWDDGTIKDLHSQTWTSGNEFIRTMYDRLFFQIASCNSFIREITPEKVSERGLTDNDVIKSYRSEARFLRALTYWHAMDLYANPTFVTEKDKVGGFLPPQIKRAELFTYLEEELLAIENEISAVRTAQYGRADQGAVWTLLAKLYLNAEAYGVPERYNDCVTYCEKIINGGYSIDPSVPYNYLFLADNDSNGAQSEFIFTIPFDGLRTQSFGGTTFIVHAAVGGSMNPRADFGINGGWFGLRTTSGLIDKFGAPINQTEVFKRDDKGEVVLDDDGNRESLGFQQIWNDKRLLAYTPGQTKEINDISNFGDGYAIQKYRNITSTGEVGSDSEDHPDTDFPMFRLADVYLMYAESVLKGTSGDKAVAVGYINQLRQRAHEGSTSFNITEADLTEDFIIDERARELYWEGHRRTDLIRVKRFTENGVWPFKGNVPQGRTTASFRNIMPIPAKEIALNPDNLKQNPEYN